MPGLSLNLGLGLNPRKGGGGVTFRNRLAVRPVSLDNAGLTTFSSWYGQNADFATVFVSQSNWVAFQISIDEIKAGFAGNSTPKIWTMPLNVVGTTLAQAAAGNFDSYYTSAATQILADAPPSGLILIRAGHEFNLAGTYPWEVINSGATAAFVSAFRRLVDRFREVSSRFRFIWNPNWISTGAGGPSFDVTTCYPGNGYVDILGTDLYYNSTLDDASADVAFEYARDLPGYGLSAQAALGQLYGKPLAFCEFGLNWDKPRWIDRMWSWIQANRFAYAGYFDANPDFNWQLSGGAYPASGARFKADFRDGGPIPLYNDIFLGSRDSWGAKGAGSVSVVSNALAVTNGGNYSNGGQRTWSGLTIGQTYTVRLDINTGNKSAKVLVIQGSSPFGTAADQTYNNNVAETKTFSFVATKTSMFVQVVPYAGDAAQVVSIDNVKLFSGTSSN